MLQSKPTKQHIKVVMVTMNDKTAMEHGLNSWDEVPVVDQTLTIRNQLRDEYEALAVEDTVSIKFLQRETLPTGDICMFEVRFETRRLSMREKAAQKARLKRKLS